MGLFFKIIGVLIVLAGYFVGEILISSFDIRQVATSNDFINAMLHQDAVVTMLEQMKQYASWGSIAISFCFGLLSFGIGVVLGRLRKLSRRLDALVKAQEAQP